MNKYYVLNNSLDRRLFLESTTSDTRKMNEALKFATRRLAEKFLATRKLSENYHPMMILSKRVNESVSNDAHSSAEEVRCAISDATDMVDTCIELINVMSSDPKLNEECFSGSNVEDVLDRLKKVKTYMSGIIFRPSFDNSLASDDIPNPESSSSDD